MNAILAPHLDAIAALCKEYGVAKLEVFGSVCTEAFDAESSDVDFLVGFPTNYDVGPWMSRVDEFEAALAAIVGRNVDLVIDSALRNPWFRREADKTRTVIFDASDLSDVA